MHWLANMGTKWYYFIPFFQIITLNKTLRDHERMITFNLGAGWLCTKCHFNPPNSRPTKASKHLTRENLACRVTACGPSLVLIRCATIHYPRARAALLACATSPLCARSDPALFARADKKKGRRLHAAAAAATHSALALARAVFSSRGGGGPPSMPSPASATFPVEQIRGSCTSVKSRLI